MLRLRIREPRNLEMVMTVKSHTPKNEVRKVTKVGNIFPTCSFTMLSFSTAVQATCNQGSGWTSRVGRWRLAGILKCFFF